MALLATSYLQLSEQDRSVLTESGVNLSNIVQVRNMLKGSPLKSTLPITEGMEISEQAREIIETKL